MKTLNYIFLLMFLLLSVTMVSAIPPVQTTTISEYGLEIEAINSLYLEQNANHTFHFRVYNASDNIYISADDVTCSMGILNNYGDYILNVPDVSNVGFRFDVLVTAGNFTETGVYYKGINCLLNDGTAGGVLTQSFEVTYTGEEAPEGIIVISFSLLLLIILSGSLVMIIKAVGHLVEKDLDLLDVGKMWGLYFGLLGINQLAQIYLGNADISNWLDLFVKWYAFPMVILPILAFILSLFNMSKKAKEERNKW